MKRRATDVLAYSTESARRTARPRPPRHLHDALGLRNLTHLPYRAISSKLLIATSRVTILHTNPIYSLDLPT
jgi:hypothetical protein